MASKTTAAKAAPTKPAAEKKSTQKSTPKTAAAKTTKRDRSTKQVEKVYVTEAKIGRVYKESSGKYVAQARRRPGGPRTRRRFATLAEAKTQMTSFVAEYREAEAAQASLAEIDAAAAKTAK